ncbi:hypothetical protein A3Q56_02444 [Intoshia linei]|uniref:Uncharacterized protein n=1 Tax=Intoshia linei TaxID=1819745 RepID=A0A177B6A7_9BILA|nr:hypothetical protein A3Q56_02444 [Intoshia linei]
MVHSKKRRVSKSTDKHSNKKNINSNEKKPTLNIFEQSIVKAFPSIQYSKMNKNTNEDIKMQDKVQQKLNTKRKSIRSSSILSTGCTIKKISKVDEKFTPEDRLPRCEHFISYLCSKAIINIRVTTLILGVEKFLFSRPVYALNCQSWEMYL